MNQSTLKEIMANLEDLFTPITPWKDFIGFDGRYPHMDTDIADSFLNTVTLRLRMLGSRQQFEFKWGETTETSICHEPALYSHAGPDGALLDEPKL